MNTLNVASSVVLVVGDSLSAEYGLKRGTGWVSLLQQQWNTQKYPTTMVNASISGETTAGGRSRLQALLQQHQPQVVVIELGANDALRGFPLDITEKNLLAMVQMAQQAGAKVLLLGMQMPPNYGLDYSRNFSGLFSKVAKQSKSALVPFFLKGIADVPNAAQFFQDDRLHPNEKAQPILAANVAGALKKLVRSKT